MPFLAFVYTRIRRPSTHLPEAESTVSPVASHPAAERRIRGLPHDGPGLAASWVIAVLVLAGLVFGCGSPSRPPLPGPDLPARLDRINDAIWEHELTVATWRGAR